MQLQNSTNYNEFTIQEQKPERIWEKVIWTVYTMVKSETGRQDYIIGKASVWLRYLF